MKPNGKCCQAFTLTDFLIVIFVLALMVLTVLPRILGGRAPAVQRVYCISNLRQIGSAIRQWSLENGGGFPMQVSVTNGGTKELAEAGVAYPTFLVLSNLVRTPDLFICPEDNRKRVVANTFDPAAPVGADAGRRIPLTNDHSVSYFVGLDAEEKLRPEALLSGDDNLLINGNPANSGLLLLRTNAQAFWTKKRHKERGNFLFADGDVASITNPAIQSVLIGKGMATNRLVLP